MCSLGGKAGKLQDQAMRTNIDGASRYVQKNLTEQADAKSDAKDAAATAAANEPARLAAERTKAEADALNSAAILGTTARRRRAQQSLMASGAAGNDQNVSASSVMAIGKGAFGS